MSNKVIRWFKRQASLRKSSDKGDDKTQVPSNNSDEKKKLSFPRLSFRRKSKKKTSFEATITPALVGISKKLSFSVPIEMASHTSEESSQTDLPTSISEGFVSVSVTNSPSKSEGDSSVASESPSHSSISCTKDSIHLPNEHENSEVSTEVKTSSELSELHNCDSEPTFHSDSSVNSSTKGQSDSILGDKFTAAITDTTSKDAPIVKIEEICDNETCMKSADEFKTTEITDISFTNNQSSFSGPENDVMKSSQREESEKEIENNRNDQNDCNLNSNLDIVVEESTSEVFHTVDKSEDKDSITEEYNVFVEIERLVNDTILLTEEGENYDEQNNESGRVHTVSERSDFGPSTEPSDDKCPSKEAGTNENESNLNDGEDNQKQLEALNKSENNEETDEITGKIFPPSHKTVIKEDLIQGNDFMKIECPNNIKSQNSGLVTINVLKEQDKKLGSNDFQRDRTKTGFNKYPKDLNPFSDDSDDDINENRWSVECSSYTRNLENENMKETELFIREPNINIEAESFSSQRSRRRFGPSKYLNSNSKLKMGTSTKSLNPFDESDDEEFNAVHEERGVQAQIPPRLPPKSLDRSNPRKYSSGCLAPVPYPRRSKLSHYGSYTSLQNMPVAPIPAPRSFVHTGSTRTLNESTNPFGDDWEDEEEDTGSFDRRVFGRSTMQAESSPCVQGPFRRSTVTGSLPPALRIRGRKKRQAPLPPKIPHTQPVPGQGDNEASLNSSHSRYSSDVRSSNPGGRISPFRPPRPPPPKHTPPDHDPVFV